MVAQLDSIGHSKEKLVNHGRLQMQMFDGDSLRPTKVAK